MPWSGIAGAAIGAAGSLIGGGISASNARDQMAMQKEFAQNGIRWKVADAKAAGIHPLAALGAQTFSYNPVMAGDNGISEALGHMGQGVSRAMEAKQLQSERELSEELTRANIDKVKAETNFVNQQAANSAAAVAKTALPPPMPRANVGPDKNVDPAFNKFSWARNPDGKYELFPSDAYTQSMEDKPFGFDLVPNLEAGLRSLYGKFTGSPVDGRRWSWSDLDWLPDIPEVRRRSEGKRVDYYQNSARYR